MMSFSPGFGSLHSLLKELKSKEWCLYLILLLACVNHVTNGNIKNAYRHCPRVNLSALLMGYYATVLGILHGAAC
ncbi:Tubulin-folding cofactor C [Psidium guajava]|nr:Tubulin-folding cofactor C [Psidium guajava]